MAGKIVTASVTFVDAVRQVKTQVFGEAGLPVKRSSFIFESKQLSDDRALLAYGVKRESALHIMSSLRGAV